MSSDLILQDEIASRFTDRQAGSLPQAFKPNPREANCGVGLGLM